MPPRTSARRNLRTPARRFALSRRTPTPRRIARPGTIAANATNGAPSALASFVGILFLLLALLELEREAAPPPFAASHRLADHRGQVHGGHVLLCELVRLLVRHPAVLQGLVEPRDRLPVLQGLLLAVQDVREVAQECRDLLRE